MPIAPKSPQTSTAAKRLSAANSFNEPLPALAVGVFRGLVNRQVDLNGIAGLADGLGGYFDLTLTSTGSFTGTLRLGALSYVLRGSMQLVSFDAPATVTLPISRKAPLLSLTVTLSINGTTGALTGSVSDGTHQTSVTAHRTTAAPAFTGVYNCALQTLASQDGTYPDGNGIASLNVSATGAATWTGRLADGGTLTFATGVGPAGDVPLHLLLYRNTGSLQGWSVISPTPQTLSGNLSWTKAPQTGSSLGASYHSGFPLHPLDLYGVKYQRPPTGQNLLNLPLAENNAKLTLRSGSLSEQILQIFTLTPAQTAVVPANASGLKLTLVPSTGWFTGSFTSTDTPKRTGSIQGIFLPGVETGLGYFLQPVSATVDPAKPVKSGWFQISRN